MEAVERLNFLLGAFDECRFQSFDGSRLIVIGDFDISYHHAFEAEFEEVEYIQCPTYFFAEAFRVATTQERALFSADTIDPDCPIFCFESDDYRYFIATQTLRLREGQVLHY
jgi:hypothetical protein